MLKEILEVQGLNQNDRKLFLTNVYQVMNNHKFNKKRNTLYMEGTADAGKSLIARSLTTSVVFSFNSGEYNRGSSNFYFEDMLYAYVALFEEPQIEPGCVERFKVVFEGGAFDAEVKYKQKGRVECVPVIITTNQKPWRFGVDERPFISRIHDYQFRNSISEKVAVKGEIHPKAWLKLIETYGLSPSLFTESCSDDETNPKDFAGTPTKVVDNLPDVHIETTTCEYCKELLRMGTQPDVTDLFWVHRKYGCGSKNNNKKARHAGRNDDGVLSKQQLPSSSRNNSTTMASSYRGRKHKMSASRQLFPPSPAVTEKDGPSDVEELGASDSSCGDLFENSSPSPSPAKRSRKRETSRSCSPTPSRKNSAPLLSTGRKGVPPNSYSAPGFSDILDDHDEQSIDKGDGTQRPPKPTTSELETPPAGVECHADSDTEAAGAF